MAASSAGAAAVSPAIPGTTPSPAKTCRIPFRMYTSPCPPASTTPAFFSTGSCSGVWASASSAYWMIRSHISSGSMVSVRAVRLFSAATLATVRMVPSVGFITAL